LLPRGKLFLGSSASIGENEAFLNTLDREHKIYQKKSDYYQSRTFIPHMNYSASSMNRLPHASIASRVLAKKPPLRQLMEQVILKECKMVGALVDEKGDILYLHGRLGMYLEVCSGEASVNNILSMAKEGLKRELTVSLHKAVETMETASSDGIDIKIDGHFKKISFEIKHIKTPDEDLPPLFAILIVDDSKDLLKPAKLDNKKTSTSDLEFELEELKTELRLKQAYIDTTNETYEITNEELQASNEELQSINEELQSTNEELETSKEELQSINEELITVNTELQVKVHELACSNNDMNNLLSGTNIATIFIDFELKLTRFTPTATKLINFIPSDVGRPIADIVSNMINYDQLVVDISSVLDTLIPKEIKINTKENKWYSMKIQPYRTIDNVIEGTVITFLEITELKRLNDALIISELRYRKMFETTLQGIIFIDALSGEIIDVNPRFVEMFGISETQLVGRYPWQVDLFKDIVTSPKDLAHLQNNDYLKYSDLLMVSAMDKKISIELISNAIVSDTHKLIQWNFRTINSDK
jgi:two-component system CheB/CheR fusion protein